MKKLLSLILALMLCLGYVSALAEIQYTEGLSEEEINALETTTVIKSDDSPTGYYVTFRYKAPEAKRVRIFGEWKFSDLHDASPFTSSNAAPEDWQNGYTIWATDGWPTAEMTLNEETGVWYYTIPLPNGTFAYRFYVDGIDGAELTDYTDAIMVADPANVNYLANPDEQGDEQMLTGVYVPRDEAKQSETIPHLEEAPRDGENGEVGYVTTTAPNGVETSYAYYLPYGFDAQREEPYPILILFHGGGGYYGSWFTNGAKNVLDNMIADGRLEPTIVVTPNGSDFPHETFRWDRPAILDYVVNTILPYMSENFNAATDPAHRAFAGLSMGGATAGYALFHNTDDFDTFCLFSAPLLGDLDPDYNMSQLKEKNIYIGYGEYDFVLHRSLYHYLPDADGNLIPLVPIPEGSILEYFHGLSQAGVTFKSAPSYPYGHQWSLWLKYIVDVFDNILWK